MMTLSSTSARKSYLIFARRLSPLLVRLVLRLSVCLASTFGLGVPLAFYGVPRMIRTIAYGYPIGFVEVFLLGLWILTLFEMWQYVRWDILRLRGRKTAREVLLLNHLLTGFRKFDRDSVPGYNCKTRGRRDP